MKAVIFDFDGTIVDSLAAVIRVLEQFTGAKRPMSESEVEKLENMSMWQISRRMQLPWWKVPVVMVRGRSLFKNHLRSVRVHPGIAELLREMHGKVPLYVLSTNRASSIEKYLTWHGLDHYFERFYGGANFLSKARKMHQLLSAEGLQAEDVWCVGDEIIDIKSAHKAGMSVASVTWGYSSRAGLAEHEPEVLVDSVADLRGVLLGQLKQDTA